VTDQELQAQMEEVYQQQQKCLRLQKGLGTATLVLVFLGVFPIFAQMFVCIFWGGHLANKATKLVRKRYPYVPIGPGFGGRGLSWDMTLTVTATRFNDELAIKIIKFNSVSVTYAVRLIFVYALELSIVLIILNEFRIV